MGGREEELCSVTRAEYIAIRWRGTSSVCVCACARVRVCKYTPLVSRRGEQRNI